MKNKLPDKWWHDEYSRKGDHIAMPPEHAFAFRELCEMAKNLRRIDPFKFSALKNEAFMKLDSVILYAEKLWREIFEVKECIHEWVTKVAKGDPQEHTEVSTFCKLCGEPL